MIITVLHFLQLRFLHTKESYHEQLIQRKPIKTG